MSTGTATVARPAAGPRIGWSPLALVFVIGATLGVVASAPFHPQAPASAGTGAAQAAPATEMSRLLGNMDAAAQRGDIRLFIQFRQDLAELIGGSGMAQYEELRGISPSGQ
jgi:hypothetical protein